MFYFSVFAIAGVGFSIALYYKLSTHAGFALKQKIIHFEDAFSTMIYHLGVKLDQNMPAERAIVKVAQDHPGTEEAEFLNIIFLNLSKNNFSLKKAIFDPKYGALVSYSSFRILLTTNFNSMVFIVFVLIW